MTSDLFSSPVAESPATYSTSSNSTPSGDHPWWSSLRHGGCLIAPSRLAEWYPNRPAEPLLGWQSDRLRRAVVRLQEDNDKQALDLLLDTVLVGLLGLGGDYWKAGHHVGEEWFVRALSGEMLKPRRLWQDAFGGVLPIFIAEEAAPGPRSKTPALGLGRGRRSVARVVEWLRRKNQKIAVLTNGHQWRLIHAGADYDAWCEWDTDAWFQEGQPGLQVDALRLLLGASSVGVAKPGDTAPLVAAIQATRRGQAELSSALGERVRQAVELLLRESRKPIDDARAHHNVTNRDVYHAAVRIVMRLVVVLFAESRLLLPIDKFTVYERSYSLQTLIALLDREGGGRPLERLRDRHGAWPRLLALFRLLYHGATHDLLTITRYGGGLFLPGDATSKDPILRALAALENPANEVSDGIVATILELLTKAPVKVRQGRAATTIIAPVDFSQLDTEYIGILYEGLLDYELRRVEDGIPILFLAVGDQPALPLTRLEEMDDKALAELVKKLGKPEKAKADDDAEAVNDEEDAEEESAEDGDEVDEPSPDAGAIVSPIFDDSDEVRLYRDRATAWATRAVEAGKLVAKPKGKLTPDKQKAYDAAIAKAAANLVGKLVLPGEYFLVRFGGTRKGSGTFYTKPQLARPTVRRTLEPLCYDEQPEKLFSPKTPADILDLKVCDPACGSGSFLVGALRYLSGALYDALLAHGWLVEQPDGRVCWGPAEPKVPGWFKELLADVPGINEPAPHKNDTDAQSPDEKIRARLKRVVVERCIYGVDLDPLAVELARLALWVETMDPFLPFSFLDHKIKCGNGLVGCWFDRFQDYPALAWEREGGDKSHTTGVHFAKEAWTKAIKAKKAEMKNQLGGQMDLFIKEADATATFDRAVALYEEMHAALGHDPEEQARLYERYRDAIAALRRAFDTWCAIWFWPADKLDVAPMPSDFGRPKPETAEITEHLTGDVRFFHWELEFPDVFNKERQGFSAIIGNPPWENLQPNPKEWFSNVDPLFRTYGRLEAQAWMTRAFSRDEAIERDWLSHNYQSKAFSNWVSNVADPQGVGDTEEAATSKYFSKSERAMKREEVRWRPSFADRQHPFRLQMGRIFTYRLFLEQGLALLKTGGRFGQIVPSAVYTDSWTTPLRQHFLERCRWDWLFGFENRDGIFAIHRSFKFCPIIVEKGGRTESIRAAFMVRDVEAWEDAERHVLLYPADRIVQFSPKSRAILEIRSDKDLAILEKMYANGVLLGDDGPDGWGIKYALEFMMNTDAKLFPPRPQWEAKDYVADEYGHWLKGAWKPATPNLEGYRSGNEISSRDGMQAIAVEDVEDVALPLYEGRMIGQFDFSQKGWVSGKGRGAVWQDIGWSSKVISPQYLMKVTDHYTHANKPTGTKVSHMRIGSATNIRSTFATLLETFAGGDTAAIFWTNALPRDLDLTAVLDSYSFDWLMRKRLGGLHLDYHVFEQNALPTVGRTSVHSGLSVVCAGLSLSGLCFSGCWLSLLDSLDDGTQRGRDARDTMLRTPWRRLWAVTPHERLRLRCILDAVVAHLYGLDAEDFRWILRDCDHPAAQVTNKAFARTLDPKGFWRVDKHQDPELRHPVLAQVAFADLQAMIREHGEEAALQHFLGTRPDDGWMLPETLRLADYNLGHDNRAKEIQPVASALGPRFFDWQLTQTAEESWAECRMHAEKIRRIRAIGRPDAIAIPATEAKTTGKTTKAMPKTQADMFDTTEQPEIFDVPVQKPSSTGAVPGKRRDLYLAVVYEIVKTNPGIREDAACHILMLLQKGEGIAGMFVGGDKERLLAAVDRFPPSFFPTPGEKPEEWWDLCETLEALRCITVRQAGSFKHLEPLTAPSNYAWAGWTTGGLVELVSRDRERLIGSLAVPVTVRGATF